MAVRSAVERKLHVMDLLEHGRDVLVATADTDGRPHMVPVSLDWDGECVVVATPLASVTGRNLAAGRMVWLSVGDMRDVVLIEAEVEKAAPVGEIEAGVSEHFEARTGWDPRDTSSPYGFYWLRPARVLVYASEEELTGRTIMKHGQWLA